MVDGAGFNCTSRHRETMVGSIARASVVSRIIRTRSGGSSSVLSRLLAASSLNSSAVSKIMTLYRPSNGSRLVSRWMSRTCSMPMRVRSLPDLAFSSPTILTSGCSPEVIRPHCPHWLHGLSSDSQLTARARSSASVVLPTCGGPAIRKECETRSESSPRCKALRALSCPIVFHMASYSYRNASAGYMRDACRAGRKVVSNEKT